jgi:CRP-like cAMP-binding protein
MPISTKSQGPPENHLLAAFPDEVYERLLPHLQPISFALGDVVYESSEQMDHLYFPTTCIVSLLYTMIDGATAEMGLVGNDGIVGIALFMGGNTVPNRALVQVAGNAFRVPAPVLQEEFRLGGECQLLLLRYTQALITQISQTAVCNRLHSIEQRLCRWLLLTHDRVRSIELRLTQEFIANMLGVRREGVTKAASQLQGAGLIRYVRGHITILDRQGLEGASCECYQVVKTEFDRLLG